MLSTSPISTDRYFSTPTTPHHDEPASPYVTDVIDDIGEFREEPGWFSSWFGSNSEGAVQGLSSRVAEMFNTRQAQITNSVRNTVFNALLRRAPQKYCDLLHHIDAFLRNPSPVDLARIRILAVSVDANEIRTLSTDLNQDGIGELTQLLYNINRGITQHPPTALHHLPTFTITAEANTQLRTASAILNRIISDYNGAFIQAIKSCTTMISAEDGPLNALREQLTHPERGLVQTTLRSAMTQFTSRTEPLLRDVKGALSAYRTALRQSNDPAVLIPRLQQLQEKIAALLLQRQLVPQMNALAWIQLEQFQHALQTHLASAHLLPASAQLLEESNAPEQMIERAYSLQRGILEEGVDAVTEVVGRVMEQLFPQPNRSPQTPSPAAIPPNPNPSSGTSATASGDWISNLLSRGRSFLNSLLSGAGNALSRQAACSLATLVRVAFEKIREQVHQSDPHSPLLGTVDPMIQRISHAIAQGSWEELTGVLEEAFRFMQDQLVYLQGVRLPLNPVRNHQSAIPNFLDNINSHRNTLAPPTQRIPQKVTEEMIQRQAKLIAMRSSSYAPARFVLEKICGINGTSAFYAEIYRPALDPVDANLALTFRQRVFEKIDASPRNFILKWLAKGVYDIVHPIASFYIHSILKRTLKEIMQWIKPSSPTQESKEEVLTKFLRNWLAVTSGAYNQVANTPPAQTRDLTTMMEEALRDPARLGGLTEQQLYASVGKAALDTFGPRIKWSEMIDNYFKKEIPPHSPIYFLNPVAKVLNVFCSFCLRALVFVPQWLGNQTLQAGAKLAFGYTTVLKDVSEQTIESLRRNTSTSFMMHSVIFRLQQNILKLLQQNLNEDAAVGARPVSNNHNIKKIELTGLVEYALEILNKGQYARTQDRLRNYLNHRMSLRDWLGHELENTFLPGVMQTAVETISVALQAVSQEDELQQMLHDGLQAANEAFNASQPVSDEEFAALEKGIREMTDQILETAIFHAVGDLFDFTQEKQKKGISLFVSTLKTQTGSFAAQVVPAIQEIANNPLLSATTLQQKITSLVESSSKYNQNRLDALSQADGSRVFHTETKYRFNEMSKELLRLGSPLSARLNQMKVHVDEMCFFDKLIPPLLQSMHIQRALTDQFLQSHLAPDDVAFCKIQLHLLKEQLNKLRELQCPSSHLDPLQNYCQELSATLNSIETLQKSEVILLRAQSLALQLQQEKIALLGSPPSHLLKSLEKQLCDQLDTLPFTEHKAQLRNEVLALMLATNHTSVISAATRFEQTRAHFCNKYLADKSRHLGTLRQNSYGLFSTLNQSFHDCSQHSVNHHNAIKHEAAEASGEVVALCQWTHVQHEQPIWTPYLFDMQWATQMVKNIAFDRAQVKVQQLFDSLYQRYNYIGLVNQTALSFLNKYGTRYLKKSPA